MPKSAVSKLVPKVPSVPGRQPAPAVLRLDQARAGRRRRGAVHRPRLRRHLAGRHRRRRPGHQGRALPPLQRQAGAVRGGLRAGRDRRLQTIQKALQGKRDPWEKARAGLRAFLEVVQEPRYRRIVMQEGPAVLGYERFREQEERSTFANVVDIVRSVLGAGDVGARRGRCCRPSPGSSSARCRRPASRSRPPRTPRRPPSGSRPRSASSSPASRPWPPPASGCPTTLVATSEPSRAATSRR